MICGRRTRSYLTADLKTDPDHHEQILLTMDRDSYSSVNGVKKINVIDFLLDRT